MSNYIGAALSAVASARAELRSAEQNDEVIHIQGPEVALLEQQVRELRNDLIRSEVARGLPTKTVAANHGMSSARISQIAPRFRTQKEAK